MIMKIEKKYILFFIGAILIVLLFGFFVFFSDDFGKRRDETNENKVSREEGQTLEEKTIKPVVNKMKGFHYEPSTEKLCNEKPGEEAIKCLEYLIADEAFAKKDPNECLKISDKERKYYCLNKIVRETRDVKICKLVDDYRFESSCFSQIAFLDNRPELCENTNEFKEKQCMGPILAFLGSATGKIEECRKIDVLEYSGLCIERLINNNHRDCRFFEKKNDQIICEDIVLYENAMEVENAKLCDLITDKTRKEVCSNILTVGKDVDSDSDGLTDGKELWFNTDPFKSDSDGDGLDDGLEMNKYETDPKKVDTINDFNKLIDDYYLYKTAKSEVDCNRVVSPDTKAVCINAVLRPGDIDYDKDGIPDDKELRFGTNPAKVTTSNELEEKIEDLNVNK